ncbi:MAG: MMPL family transporter [Candidatus Omnitrophica bacterium]|nr:MMPL family transporter [Candidatus Omnitrophota bacterium]
MKKFEFSGSQAQFVYRYAGWILLGILLITLVSIPYARRLEFHANFMELLPARTPSILALEELNSHVGGSSYLIAVLESPSEKIARAAAEKLADQAGSFPEVGYVNNRTDVPAFKDRKLLFLNLASIHKLYRDVEAIANYYRRNANPFYLDLLDEDAPTLDLASYEAEEKVTRIGGFGAQGAASFMQVVLIKPLHPLSDFDRSEILFEKLRASFDAIKKNMKGRYPVTMALTGPYKVRYDECRTISRDLRQAGMIAVVLVGLILSIGFRSFRSIAYICVPITIALIWTGAFAYFAIGYLNLISAFLFALLLGMGIDYAIHIRIVLEQNQIHLGDMGAAIEQTYADVGKPVFTGCLTTSIAFFMLAISPFEGFRHFGIISGAGILFSFIAAFYGMPSLMAVAEKHFPRKACGKTFVPHSSKMPRQFVYAVLIAGVLFTVYSLTQLRNMKFDYNFANLQARDEGIQLALRVYEHFGVELTPAAYMTPDRGHAVELAGQMNREISERPESTFDFAASIMSHVPRQQSEKIMVLRRIEDLVKRHESFLEKLDPETKKNIEDLRPQLQATGMPWQELPKGMKHQYEGDNQKLSVVYVFPKEGILDGQVAKHFVKELREMPVGKGIQLAGEPVIYADILKLLERDSPRALGLSLFMIILVLFLSFKNPAHVCWVLFPVITAILWMIGMAGAIKFNFNYVNVVILPGVLGAGIDNGIYIYNCYHTMRGNDFLRVLRNTRRGVILSSLSTIAAFASLTGSHHAGIASAGVLGVLGFASCFLTSVLVLPVLIQFFETRRKPLQAPAARVQPYLQEDPVHCTKHKNRYGRSHRDILPGAIGLSSQRAPHICG